MAIVWLATVVALLLGYRPGGPLDGMVALGPALATAVAVASAAWPPIFRGRRAWQAVAWLGIGTLLVLLPTAADLISRLAAEGPAPLLPSPSSAYAWLVSLVGTALFSGLGVSRRMLAPDADRRRGVALGIGIAAVTVGLAGSLSGAAGAANDDAL